MSKEITITIPDQVWQEDENYSRYFEAVQFMVNRMAMSHYKYGPIGDRGDEMRGLDDMLSLRYRLCMYDGEGPRPEKPVNTGNTENLLDAANFALLEYLFPRHPKAKFRAQSSNESPGLAYK